MPEPLNRKIKGGMVVLDKKTWCGILYRNSKKRAEKNSMAFDISEDYLQRLWVNGDGKCALTGIRFSCDGADSAARRPFAPSLDRIDRRKGYIKRNVRIVCVAVNMALFTWGENVFDEVVKARRDVLALQYFEEKIPPKTISTPGLIQDFSEDKFMDRLSPRGRIESFFGLCPGWFCRREKAGLPVPTPHSTKEYPSGARRYLYEPEVVAEFLNYNAGSREWRP